MAELVDCRPALAGRSRKEEKGKKRKASGSSGYVVITLVLWAPGQPGRPQVTRHFAPRMRKKKDVNQDETHRVESFWRQGEKEG